MHVFLCNIRQFFSHTVATLMYLYVTFRASCSHTRRLPCFVRGVMGKTLLFMYVFNVSSHIIPFEVPDCSHSLTSTATGCKTSHEVGGIWKRRFLSENTTHQMFSVYTEKYNNATITIRSFWGWELSWLHRSRKAPFSENVSLPHENFSSLRGVFERMA